MALFQSEQGIAEQLLEALLFGEKQPQLNENQAVRDQAQANDLQSQRVMNAFGRQGLPWRNKNSAGNVIDPITGESAPAPGPRLMDTWYANNPDARPFEYDPRGLKGQARGQQTRDIEQLRTDAEQAVAQSELNTARALQDATRVGSDTWAGNLSPGQGLTPAQEAARVSQRNVSITGSPIDWFEGPSPGSTVTGGPVTPTPIPPTPVAPVTPEAPVAGPPTRIPPTPAPYIPPGMRPGGHLDPFSPVTGTPPTGSPGGTFPTIAEMDQWESAPYDRNWGSITIPPNPLPNDASVRAAMPRPTAGFDWSFSGGMDPGPNALDAQIASEQFGPGWGESGLNTGYDLNPGGGPYDTGLIDRELGFGEGAVGGFPTNWRPQEEILGGLLMAGEAFGSPDVFDPMQPINYREIEEMRRRSQAADDFDSKILQQRQFTQDQQVRAADDFDRKMFQQRQFTQDRAKQREILGGLLMGMESFGQPNTFAPMNPNLRQDFYGFGQ